MTREQEINDKIQNLITELQDGIVRLENTPDMFEASIHEIKAYIDYLLARIAKLENNNQVKVET